MYVIAVASCGVYPTYHDDPADHDVRASDDVGAANHLRAPDDVGASDHLRASDDVGASDDQHLHTARLSADTYAAAPGGRLARTVRVVAVGVPVG